MTITGTVFLLAFLVGMAMALIRHPIYGLYTYVAVFYLHPPSRWWGASLPDLRWAFLAAAITLLAILMRLPNERGSQSWLASTPAKVMIAFSLWFWIGGLWALDTSLHYPAAILVTKYVLVFFMVYRLIDTPAKTTAFLLAHVAGCLYLGLLAYQADAPGGRLDGVGGPGIDDSNTLGMHLATGVVVGAMLTLQLRGWRLLLCIMSIAFSLNAIVLTGTRGGFLALASGGLMISYLKPNAYRRLFYFYALLGVGLLAYVASEQFWERMATTEAVTTGDAAEMDTSAYSRIEMFKAQILMAEEYPFGSGQRGSEVLSPLFLDAKYMAAQGGRSSHNTFMTILVEQGIPGAILSLILVGWAAGTLRRLARTSKSPDGITRAIHASAIGGALAVVLVGGLFADFAQCEVQVWMLALLAALNRRPVALSARLEGEAVSASAPNVEAVSESGGTSSRGAPL